ncbi:hypothetical protein ACHAXN_007231 [Cyclotella atomus]
MRIGKNPKKRRTKSKSAPLPNPHPNLVVGQISANLIDSLYGPLLRQIAEQSIENYADELLTWNELQLNEAIRTKDAMGGEDGVEVQVDIDGTIEDTELNVVNTPKPAPPLFSASADLESLEQLLTDLSTHFTSTYKAHANIQKFERLLDEKYGRLRPFIESHPQVEWAFKKIQRKYAKGEFSPIGKRPIGLSSAIMMLFMLRQRVELSVLILIGLFTIVGLQPWALVFIVTVGRYSVEKRRKKRLNGMAKKVKVVESYYATDKEESEESEKERKYQFLKRAVGTKFNAADLTLRDEKFDVICLGAGVEALYAAALLARAGKNVCVLCPNEDASGCVSITKCSKGMWGAEVPFDIHSHSAAYISKQQSLLAPALCTSTDAQGGIRFARVGSEADGYAHSILSVPGLGTNSSKYEDIEPVVLNSRGASEIAQFCYNVLGDGYPTIDEGGNDDGNSVSLSYLKACSQINAGAGDYYLSRLFPANSSSESAFKSPECNAYRSSTIRSASAFLNKCVPLHPHVRSFMGAIGMMNENLNPDKTCMAAHVSNLCAMTSVEGLSYPVGGPRALCHALASVIEQCGGRVVTSVTMQELLFDESKIGDQPDKKDNPRCRGIRLENGMEVTTASGGSVISFLGFIPTFLHLMTDETRTADSVPMGLPALTERRPLMKVLVGIKGTKEDLNLTGADWYRLPNATVPRDELDENGQVRFGAIGIDDGSGDSDDKATMDVLTSDHDPEDETAATALSGKRGERSKGGASTTSAKAPPRKKFTTGVSWMKVSFPSAKDPSWKERHGNITTCVVTVEADDDFVKLFDTKPKVFSILKKSEGDLERFRDRVLKDLLEIFPQIQRKDIDSVAVVGPIRAGLTHDPPKFAIKGNRPVTPHPGLVMGGSDLTVGDSFSGSIAGAWLAANAVMGYSFIDHLYLRKNITSDLRQFLDDPSMAVERNGKIVEDEAVPYKREIIGIDKKGDQSNESGSKTAESSKEE